jgi:hypothetical protein
LGVVGDEHEPGPAAAVQEGPVERVKTRMAFPRAEVMPARWGVPPRLLGSSPGRLSAKLTTLSGQLVASTTAPKWLPVFRLA